MKLLACLGMLGRCRGAAASAVREEVQTLMQLVQAQMAAQQLLLQAACRQKKQELLEKKVEGLNQQAADAKAAAPKRLQKQVDDAKAAVEKGAGEYEKQAEAAKQFLQKARVATRSLPASATRKVSIAVMSKKVNCKPQCQPATLRH